MSMNATNYHHVNVAYVRTQMDHMPVIARQDIAVKSVTTSLASAMGQLAVVMATARTLVQLSYVLASLDTLVRPVPWM